jgi:hypothetical protein
MHNTHKPSKVKQVHAFSKLMICIFVIFFTRKALWNDVFTVWVWVQMHMYCNTWNDVLLWLQIHKYKCIVILAEEMMLVVVVGKHQC